MSLFSTAKTLVEITVINEIEITIDEMIFMNITAQLYSYHIIYNYYTYRSDDKKELLFFNKKVMILINQVREL